MDSKYKNLQDKLNQPSRVPDGLKWDNMEAGIFSKLDERAESEAKTEKTSNRIVFLLFLLILVIGSVMFFKNKSEILSQSTTIEITEKNSTSKPNKDLAKSKSETNRHSSTSINNNIGKEGNSNRPVVNSTKSKDFKQKENKKQNAQEEFLTHEYSTSNNILKSITRPDLTDAYILDRRSTKLDRPSNSDKNTHASNKTIENVTELKRIISFTNFSRSIPNTKELPTILNENMVTKGPRSMLGISFGFATWNAGFSPTKSETYEQTRLSYLAHMQYDYFIKSRLFLSTGLSYYQLHSRLDWSDRIYNYEVTLEDIIVKTNYNLLTGETEHEIETVEVEVEADRMVRHYNQSNLIQLPIGIGLVQNFKTFNLSLIAGTSINILGRSEGRLLHDGQIIDYSGSSNDLFSSQYKINGFVQSRLDYALSQKWNLSFGAGYQRSISNWSKDREVKQFPFIFSTQLGLSYNFQ